MFKIVLVSHHPKAWLLLSGARIKTDAPLVSHHAWKTPPIVCLPSPSFWTPNAPRITHGDVRGGCNLRHAPGDGKPRAAWSQSHRTHMSRSYMASVKLSATQKLTEIPPSSLLKPTRCRRKEFLLETPVIFNLLVIQPESFTTLLGTNAPLESKALVLRPEI